ALGDWCSACALRYLKAQREAPAEFGPWDSRAIELPPSAIQLLKPNAILSRRFFDAAAQRTGDFLIVQCKDARSLSGHWPPNCYKATGYTQTDQRDRTWQVDGLSFPGIEYTFAIDTVGRRSELVVANFMILPGVGFAADMDSVREAGSSHLRRHFGAAQVQVVSDAAYPRDQRDAVFVEIVRAHLPLIRAIADLPAD
ncbi:MAG: exosortase-associated EpsI family protein, partial [Planctomycetota bacterium]